MPRSPNQMRARRGQTGRTICVLLGIAFSSGCTHTALRDNTLAMSETLTELQYRIVLNNLAMLVSRPGSLPWHTKFDEGTIQVTDRARSFLDLPGLATVLDPGVELRARHTITGQWRIVPVTNPEELIDLQAVYRLALGKDIEDEVRERLDAADSIATGWWQHGSKDELPKDAAYIGRYRDTYVWVPVEQVEELTKLTLAVLTIVKFKEGERTFGGGGLAPVPE